MSEHAVVVVGAGPAGMMLTAELALAKGRRRGRRPGVRITCLPAHGPAVFTRARSRCSLLDASYEGEWDLPALGVVGAPSAVLIRPDGYVAWVGDGTDHGLPDALVTWFGPATAA